MEGAEHIRIVFVGDDKCGKTSLVNAAITDKFQERLVPVLQELEVPINPPPPAPPVVLHLIDTSNRDKEQREREIKRANCILVLFDISDKKAFARVASYWIPSITELVPRLVPILVVATKSDLARAVTDGEIQADLVDKCWRLEDVVFCSAKTNDVAAVFDRAQYSVYFPVAPLLDLQTQTLTPEFLGVLERLYLLLVDNSREGVRPEGLLNLFSKIMQVTQADIDHLITTVQNNLPSGVTTKGWLTVQGFKFLFFYLLLRRSTDVVWGTLRLYGYDETLKPHAEVLQPSDMGITENDVVELNKSGVEFLTNLFNSYDDDKDGAISARDMQFMFLTTPGPFWQPEIYDLLENEITEDKNGKVARPSVALFHEKQGKFTLKEFLELWHMLVLQNWRMAVRYIYYLGYMNHQKNLFTKIPRKKKASRKVLQCIVIDEGATTPKAKSTKKPGSTDAVPPVVVSSAIDANKYLVVMRYQHYKPTLDLTKADVIAVGYDIDNDTQVENATATFHSIKKQYPFIPIVFVATSIETVKGKAPTASLATTLIKYGTGDPSALQEVFAQLYTIAQNKSWLGTVLMAAGVVAVGAAAYFYRDKITTITDKITATTTSTPQPPQPPQ